MYIIIGWIAVEVAFHHSNRQADRTGALHAISATPVGGVLLWLLVIGFIGMTLWRLSEALYGSPGSGGYKASRRLAALGRAIVYGFIAYGVLKYALGTGGPQSSNQQSVDLTARGPLDGAGGVDELHGQVPRRLGYPAEGVDEVHVPGRSAELAIGGRLQAHLLLHPHRPGNLLIFDRPEVSRRDPAGREVIPRVKQPLRAQQAADVVGAERRTASTRHR